MTFFMDSPKPPSYIDCRYVLDFIPTALIILYRLENTEPMFISFAAIFSFRVDNMVTALISGEEC